MASATAAARSETPSFSYTRWRWVLTVVAPEVQLARDVGRGQPVGGHPEDLVLARREEPLLVAAPPPDLLGHRRLHVGAERRASLGGGHERVADLVAGGVLRQVAAAPLPRAP
jgi:hypothetical protein